MNKASFATLLLFVIILNIQDTNGQCSLSEFVVFDPESPGPYISCLNDPCNEISAEVSVGECATKSHCIVHDNKCYAKKRVVQVVGDNFGLSEVLQSINSTNSTAPTTAIPDNTDERLFPLGKFIVFVNLNNLIIDVWFN
uniref:Kazal-like domain-containing protein n=1 Tax=Ciona intestinalis TaxID=7719 RepID=F6V0I9_CIOIN